MKTLKYLFGFILGCFFVFQSCSEIERTSSNEALERTTVESINKDDCEIFRTSRLLVNETYSVLVYQCYKNNVLTGVDYKVTERLPDDKYSVLDFRPDSKSGSNGTILNILGKDLTPDTSKDKLFAAVSIADDPITYGCECKDANPDAVDCVKRKYLNEHYCDGNFCQACSLLVQFTDDSGPKILSEISAFILPENF